MNLEFRKGHIFVLFRFINPTASLLPILCYKLSVCLNPLMYVGMHPQFRGAFKDSRLYQLFSKGSSNNFFHMMDNVNRLVTGIMLYQPPDPAAPKEDIKTNSGSEQDSEADKEEMELLRRTSYVVMCNDRCEVVIKRRASSCF